LTKLLPFNPVAKIRKLGSGFVARDILTLLELSQLFPQDRRLLEAIWGDLLWASFFYY
jgi:hypothetical protein